MRKWYRNLLSAVLRIGRRRGFLPGWLAPLADAGNGLPPAPEGALERTIADLNKRQEDMAFLGGVAQLFQACRSVDELCQIARARLESLSPRLSGALYLMSETNDYLDNVMSWGAIEATPTAFAPHDCWALRCGRAHQVGQGHDAIACGHADAAAGDWHLCVPLMAQGEALGILYFRVDTGARGVRPGIGAGAGAGGTPVAEERLQFYFNVAETLSLAVANMQLRESLQDQAIRDPLTGLFNRRYFQETLKRELHRASRFQQPLALVMIDVDYFKLFNDTHGHDAGDAALTAVGGILAARTRAGDVACRHGGEEFVLAFPSLSAEVAAQRVEAIRQEIAAREIQFLGQIIEPVTISAGIAVYPENGMDAETLMRVADRALYASKNAGRNRLTMASALLSRDRPRPRPAGADVVPLSLVRGGQAVGEREQRSVAE